MLKEEYIELDTQLSTKEEALRYISQKALQYQLTDDKEDLYQDFLNREAEFSTGLQDGFAIPHARSNHVKDIAIMYIRTNKDIDWGTLDEKPVRYMFALLVPSDLEGQVHLEMISKLATCLLEDDFKNKVKSLTDKTELKEYIFKEMEG